MQGIVVVLSPPPPPIEGLACTRVPRATREAGETVLGRPRPRLSSPALGRELGMEWIAEIASVDFMQAAAAAVLVSLESLHGTPSLRGARSYIAARARVR